MKGEIGHRKFGFSGELGIGEILLSVLVGLLCRAEDFDEIEDLCAELLDWLRLYLPFKHGVAPSQTLRRTLARLDLQGLATAFGNWSAGLAGSIKGVLAIDGKTLPRIIWQLETGCGRPEGTG